MATNMRYSESEAGVGIPVYRESDWRSKKWRKLHILHAPPGTPVVIQQGVMTLLFGVYPLGSPLDETNSQFDKVCPNILRREFCPFQYL